MAMIPVPEIERGTLRDVEQGGVFLRSLYMVLSGGFKTEVTLEAGECQIADVALRGDLLGAGAMENGRHYMTATALVDSRVCVIPAGRRESERMAKSLVQALGHRMRDMQWTSVRLRAQSAEQAVIGLLLRVEAAQVEPASPLRLPFSRAEIANYLGIAVETVSRVFQRLQRDGLLRTSGRRVWLLDSQALHRRLGEFPGH